jgi:hypothetical protein
MAYPFALSFVEGLLAISRSLTNRLDHPGSVWVAALASGYLNFGITFSANSRMFFIAISCGMPPK